MAHMYDGTVRCEHARVSQRISDFAQLSYTSSLYTYAHMPARPGPHAQYHRACQSSLLEFIDGGGRHTHHPFVWF